MRKRKKSGDRTRNGRRAAAVASEKGGAGSGNPLESILDIVSEATRQVPERDWAQLPSDLAKNVDHYLYGTKKKEK
jgi:hypothetical protein